MRLLKNIKASLLHLAYPHVCTGCGNDNVPQEVWLCFDCLSTLPETKFNTHPHNPIEKIFWGRMPVNAAMAQYYFAKGSITQQLVHTFKYKDGIDLGIYLGRQMGHSIAATNRFEAIDALVPLPLFKTKEKKRGFNQAEVLCRGIAQIIGKPVIKNAVIRNEWTETQTKKTRVERWQNMDGRFEVTNEEALVNKHLLLVDDIITTGATLEACGQQLLQIKNTQLSVAALCYSVN